ncbi:hypothetical protein GQ457_12G018540 [Hibiscus cannabinus]
MDSEENIEIMSDWFSTIVNELKGFVEVISENKLLRKLIYSLLESWKSKKTMIIEAKSLKTLKLNNLEKLIGSLLTHEMISKGKKEENKENNVVLKSSSY